MKIQAGLCAKELFLTLDCYKINAISLVKYCNPACFCTGRKPYPPKALFLVRLWLARAETLLLQRDS